jgi:alpha-1,3-rhamnosyl/mannosyltransferase
MRVVFDLNPVLRSRFSGFYTFGKGLLNGFNTLSEKPQLTLFFSNRFDNQARFITTGLDNFFRLKGTFVKMRWLERWWQMSSRPSLEYFTGAFDIYHCFHHLMPPTKGKPKVMTVHDLRRYKLPDLYQGSKLDLFESAVKRADHFITVSEATKKDLCSIFNLPPEKVSAVPLATDYPRKRLEESEKQEKKDYFSKVLGTNLGHFIVAFSSPDRRKNITRIIQSFIQAKEDLPDEMKLVIVGNPPKNDRDFDVLINDRELNEVVLTGPIEDIESLLSCSDGLVFASLYEGFGIPILEAFSSGIPVITSNCSSMPEVAADAAIYVDPEEIDSISQGIVTLCTNLEVRTALIEKGFDRLKHFSWPKTAAETLEVYKKLL